LMIKFKSTYSVRLALSLAQFAYIVLFTIISYCEFKKKVEQPGDQTVIYPQDTPIAGNSFFYARNKLQPCQRSFRKNAIQSAAHLFEEADRLHRSQSTTLKWKHG
jgi:hypothetical protein